MYPPLTQPAHVADTIRDHGVFVTTQACTSALLLMTLQPFLRVPSCLPNVPFLSQDHFWHTLLHLVTLSSQTPPVVFSSSSSPSLPVWDGYSVPLSFVAVTVSRGTDKVSWGTFHLGLPDVLSPGWFAPSPQSSIVEAELCFPPFSWGTVCRGGELLLGRRGVHYSPECGLVCCFYVGRNPVLYGSLQLI